ncbi:proprotein convertase P-domain-containing protein [Micromonospora sp. NPDC001898]|uniref:proprotein convertase P-domain-containing protein n=1 Tax=Micromonospora sp. NPDC001898 TaxID=3364221 RepID=UPI00369802D4
MRSRTRFTAALAGAALLSTMTVTAWTVTSATASSAPPPSATAAAVDGVARALGISADDARRDLQAQDRAHRVAAALPAPLQAQSSGKWFDPQRGLIVAVTTEAAAAQVHAAGAQPQLVKRGPAELGRLAGAVRTVVGKGVPGIYGWGVDVQANVVNVNVNTTRQTAATDAAVARLRALGSGVRLVHSDSQPRQQAGDIRTGSPWWPGTESNCSVGFAATDSAGGKHFLTAGHCTDNANQAAYGQSGQQNKIGTSNVGGTRSVNAPEGDMGVVAVTEAGWNLSASVNTWDQPAVTVTGSAEAMVGDRVCHSGNTSKWQCGVVKYTHKSVDYGGGMIIEDLTWTTACSLGGDSGGGWLLGDKAVGLHDGGPSSCVTNPTDGDLSIFQPVNEALAKWNLTLVTGSGGDTAAPTAPGNPRATATTANSVSLAWDAATDNVGVTAYDVYRGSALATTVTGLTATVNGLTADTAYSFTVQARDAANNSSGPTAALSVRTKPAGGSGRTFTSNTDYQIYDYNQLFSPVTSTATGSAASTVKLVVTINHTCAEDLGIFLVAPNGYLYAVKYNGGFTCTPWNGPVTFTVPSVFNPASGVWKLRVTDYGPGNTGVLDSWSITL